jgi:cytochrome b6
MASKARSWISERAGAGDLAERLAARRIPSRSITHYLGGVVLFLFLIEVLSGILLLLPYRPDPTQAHDSIVAIMGRVPYGALIRGVHYWTTNLFIGGLALHLAAILITRRYRPPRELVWVSGMVLLLFGLALAFTGAILPWSQSAYLQARVSSEMVGHAPLIGGWLKVLLRGGEDVSAWTLHHAFGTHTGVLPAVSTLVIAGHVMMVQKKPFPVYESDAGVRTIPVYPDFLVRLAALCTGVLVVVISLATFASVPVGTAVDFGSFAPAHAAPPWYFLFLHQLLRASPSELAGIDSAKLIIGIFTLIGVAVFALPFLDRKGSRVTLVVAGGFFVLWILLTAYALL